MSSNFNPQFSKLGEILIKNGKATESGVNDALAEQKVTNGKIGTTLIEMGYIEEDDFTSAYADQLGYRTADNFMLLEADILVSLGFSCFIEFELTSVPSVSFCLTSDSIVFLISGF